MCGEPDVSVSANCDGFDESKDGGEFQDAQGGGGDISVNV